jgi:hypothetical protein
MDIFKKAMAVCAAVASFSGAGYIFFQGAELELVKRVSAQLATSTQRIDDATSVK